jgi:NAD+ kinase
VKSLAIISKKHKADAWQAGQALQAWFVSRGLSACHLENEPEPDISPLPPETEFIVVLGGDGTILSVSRHYGGLGLPILGVNMGGLGFLTEISLEDLYPCLEEYFLPGKFEVDERMILSVSLIRGGETLWRENVLNDAVINKGALARIGEFPTWIDGEYLTTYRADGLIVSTSTGSTAYTMSAGGPIAYPTLGTIILLPICPHALSNRPIILPETVTVAVTLDEKVQDLYLTLDGQVGRALKPQDRLEVRSGAYHVRLVKHPRRSYFEILRTKLGWEELGRPCR